MSDQNERVLDQFGQQAKAYAALVNDAVPREVDPLIELTAPTPDDRALDVGCGTGQFVVKISRFVASAIGVDLTPAMLEQARAHQAAQGVSNVSWERADSTALPYENAHFTMVFSRSMFHHAADPEATLAEMRRVCDKAGRIAVMDLTPEATRAPAFDAFELLRDPSHARALTTTELREMGQRLGLKEIALRTRASSMPFEAVLSTSFPAEGVREKLGALLRRDVLMGGNAFGLCPQMRDDALWVTYPLTTVVWQHEPQIP